MSKKRTLMLAVLAVTILGSGRMLVVAGPLDPPSGPVQPTMHTLEDIYQRLGDSCCTPKWSFVKTPAVPSGQFVRVIEGQGVLHAVIYREFNTGFTLRDGNGREIVGLGGVTGSTPTSKLVLDVPFQLGVEIGGSSGSPSVTLLYSPGLQ